MDADWVKERTALMRASFSKPPPKASENSFRLENWLAECPGGLTYARAARLVPFYEESGDFLCFDGKGQATWIGWETGGVMAFGSVSDALNELFDHLRKSESFTKAFTPV